MSVDSPPAPIRAGRAGPASGRRTAWLAALVLPLGLGAPWVSWLGRAGAEPRLATLSGMVVTLLVATAGYTDLRWGKIFNWATYPALLWALLINAAGGIASAWGIEPSGMPGFVGPGWLGAVGPVGCVLGALGCFVPMLLTYRASGGGAGDVKLATAIGALLGPQRGILSLLCAYLIAGVAILAWATWTLGPLFLLRSLLRRIGSALLPGWVAPPAPAEARLLQRPVRLGPFYAIGTLIVLLDLLPN